ncbi:MAG: hypothetical protein ACHQWV_04785 [Nitrospirales bacterium]
MLEVWTSQEKLDSLEADWRTAWKARSLTAWQSLPQSSLAGNGNITAVFIPTTRAEGRIVAEANPRGVEDDLYQRLIDQRARYHQSVDWYHRVSRRVQTRLEEDEMLYSTLGTLVSSPMMLVFYPIVRWNVRSVLWDEGDPDSPDDPVRRFCMGRLEGIDPSNAPLVP